MSAALAGALAGAAVLLALTGGGDPGQAAPRGRRGDRGAGWVSRRVRSARAAGRSQPPVVLDTGIVLTLARAALAAGASVPGTLTALGRCAGEPALSRAGATLLLGGSWEEAVAEVPPRHRLLLDALAPAWIAGADPTPLLGQAAEAIAAGRDRRAKEAAARLGVRLVLPLGLCHLPAFVLLGLVPVVVSVAGDLVSLTPLTP